MTTRTVALPDVGDFEFVTITSLPHEVGSRIQRGSTMISIESDKASMDLPAPVSGIVRAIHVTYRQKVSRGDPLLDITPIPLTCQDLKTEMEYGRATATSLATPTGIGRAQRLERITASLSSLLDEVRPSTSKITVYMDHQRESLIAQVHTEIFHIESALSLNSRLDGFKRVDVVQRRDQPDQSHSFTYVFDEEATLEYSKWIGWAVGILQSDAPSADA